MILQLTIPFAEVTGIEKKMTAFVIPNAIQISTRKAKYTFASFITRDTSFDVMFNVWRLCQPQGPDSHLTSRSDMDSGSISEYNSELAGGAPASNAPRRTATVCACSKSGEHFEEVMMECIFPGTPEQIHNLMWTSGFIREFMSENQKLFGVFPFLSALLPI